MSKESPVREHYIDKDSSTIFLVGDVDSKMYSYLVAGLNKLEQSAKLTVVLNTYGGEVYQALAIYDSLRYCVSIGCDVKIVCCGPVMSAGTLILQAATERVAMENSYLMVHYGEDSANSSSDAVHNKELLRLFQKILAERAKVKKRTVNSWFKTDTYFSASRALEVGLVDRLVTNVKKT